MSDYKCPLTNIVTISPHPDSQTTKLEIATVYGFQIVVKKNQYKVGDMVILIPIDSILPDWLETKLFPPDSKIKLNSHRVRQIRIRGCASQGMLIDPKDVREKLDFKKIQIEDNVAELLEVTKYEPPAIGPSFTQGKNRQRNKSYEHPLFHQYNGLDNIKFFPTFFKDGELVVIQEKLHGCNARASKLPYQVVTLLDRIKKFFRLLPEFQNCYGSNKVQKSVARNAASFYEEDVWGITFKQLDVFNKLYIGETVFGEIIGPGIQKNYNYGLKEYRFVLFDVKILDNVTGKQYWLNPNAVKAFAEIRGFEYVPVLYEGPYNKDLAYGLTKGPSVYDPKTKVREGIVIKDANIYNVEGNKRALKWVSEEYLDDKSNTDFH